MKTLKQFILLTLIYLNSSIFSLYIIHVYKSEFNLDNIFSKFLIFLFVGFTSIVILWIYYIIKKIDDDSTYEEDPMTKIVLILILFFLLKLYF